RLRGGPRHPGPRRAPAHRRVVGNRPDAEPRRGAPRSGDAAAARGTGLARQRARGRAAPERRPLAADRYPCGAGGDVWRRAPLLLVRARLALARRSRVATARRWPRRLGCDRGDRGRRFDDASSGERPVAMMRHAGPQAARGLVSRNVQGNGRGSAAAGPREQVATFCLTLRIRARYPAASQAMPTRRILMPSARPIAGVVLGAVVLFAVGAAPARADKCTAVKLKAIGKKESGLLACYSKLAASGDPSPFGACVEKVEGKYGRAFSRAGSCVAVPRPAARPSRRTARPWSVRICPMLGPANARRRV